MTKIEASKALQNAVAYLKGKKIIKKENEISMKTGYSKGSVSNYIRGTQIPSPAFIEKFESTFDLDINNFKGRYENTEEDPLNNIVMEDSPVYNITLSNRNLAEAQKDLAEASRILAECNADLVQMVKTSINLGGSGTPVADQAIHPKVLELIAQAAVGKYKSKEEALAALSNMLFGLKGSKGSAGN